MVAVAVNVMTMVPPGMTPCWPGWLHPSNKRPPFCMHLRKLIRLEVEFAVSNPQVTAVGPGFVAVTEMPVGVPAPAGIATVAEPIVAVFGAAALLIVSV